MNKDFAEAQRAADTEKDQSYAAKEEGAQSQRFSASLFTAEKPDRLSMSNSTEN